MEFLDECYVCKKESLGRHHFYERLCPPCGELNFAKRESTADLTGYTALVTGGRLKIGFETALKLLRCGARVIITTRFEQDAYRRFFEQPDAQLWKDRLRVYAADFRVTASVEDLIRYTSEEFEVLDILINNAAQTVRRPPAFYKHLLDINNDESKNKQALMGDLLLPLQENSQKLAKTSPEHRLATYYLSDPQVIAQLSQLPLMPGDEIFDTRIFPPSKVDKDGQQEDRRDFNSWVMELEDIPLIEFLEVMYINVVAPFLLCSCLKSRMKKRDDDRPSFIVNVTAMEGNFYNPDKSHRHPHTNMAKAALNMLTRTSANDFYRDRIFMTSVDPGFITYEKPFPLTESYSMRKKVKLAIDEVDGAARMCDPIFSMLNENKSYFGVLLKNYMVYPW